MWRTSRRYPGTTFSQIHARTRSAAGVLGRGHTVAWDHLQIVWDPEVAIDAKGSLRVRDSRSVVRVTDVAASSPRVVVDTRGNAVFARVRWDDGTWCVEARARAAD